MSDRKRLLNDLRVIDLRAELEKRNLDKGGVRSVLIQRLSKHLEEEGLDPTTFKFDIVGPDPKTPKKVRRSGSAVDQEAEETPAMEDMIVQDDAGEEEDPEQSTKDKKQEPKSEEKMDVEDSEKISRKRESNDDSEVTPPKKPCLEKETKTEDDLKDANTDAEDSINLDINEYELLNDEGDNNTTSKKDEGGEQEAAAADDAPAPRDPRDARDAAALAEQTEHQPDNAEPAANSYEVDKNGEKEDKDEKDKNGEAEKGEKKEEGKESGARNLWISGLSGDTRAKDLKQLCTKYGKVIGAKVVTNARTPGSRCYGYVTMASAQDAENCIKNLHRTELHGRMISVEKAKSESESASRRQPSRNERRASKDHSRDEGKENEDKKEGDKDEEGKERPKKEGDEPAEESRSQSRTREKSQRSDKDKKRSTRSRERGGRRSPREVLSFSKIWKERDAARARSRARAAREEERRRRAADDALRERERRQRQEKHRLALEREKLRQEREKIEREKNELLRLERERHRLEREKLELERLELKRAQLRLEEERRKRGYESAYRKAGSPPPEPAYERERHKRAAPPSAKIPSSRSGHFEAPPPPRFDVGAAYERDKRDSRDTRDYKRDYPRHAASATSMKYSSNGSANDDARQPMPPGTRPKEPRTYESREGGRGYRSPPSNKAEHRWLPPAHAAHHDASTASKGSSGAGEHWSGEARYGASYEPRYSSAFQPPPPGAAYPDRYPPPAAHAPHAAHPTHAAHAPRDYPRKY